MLVKKKKIKLYWRFCRRYFKPWWKKDPLIHSLYLFVGVLGLCLFIVVFLTGKGGIFAWLLDTKDKNETIRFITLGMGGALAAIGAVAFSHRANAQIRHNKLIEKGHIDERFKSATENLGHNEASVRIASFYQFYYLAKDQPDNFRKSIFDILCSYLRAMPHGKSHLSKNDKERPTAECQTLLNILFMPDDKYVFTKFQADLRNSYLVHTDLTGVNFVGANLSDADFSNSMLDRANFLGTILSLTNLSNTHLSSANLSEAILVHTNLSGANISNTNLSNTMLIHANLFGANLTEANLSDTSVSGTNLSDAILVGANLSDAILSNTNLLGAMLVNTCLQRTLLEDMNLMEVRNIKHADFRGAKIGGRPITKDDLPADKGEYYADWNPPPEKEEN